MADDAGRIDRAPPRADLDLSVADARRELGDLERVHEQRRRQLPRAIVVGILVGLVAVAFRQSLLQGRLLSLPLFEFAHTHSRWALLLPVLLGAAGAAIAVTLVRRIAPEASGSGIPHVKAVMRGTRTMRRRVLPVKFFGGIAGIGTGMVMGREGPTIQMGAAIGHTVSGWFACTAQERRTLVAAGAGAGLAAAFNAPLAGLVFVLEELQRDFSPAVFSATLVASAVADVLTRMLLGQHPVFRIETAAIPSLAVLPAALFVGAVAAILGIAFNRALLASLDAFAGLRRVPPWVAGATVGGVVASFGLIDPDLLGGGDHLVERMLGGTIPFDTLVWIFAVRFALTMTCYGSGAPGGIFAPLLSLGSALGLALGQLISGWFPGAFGSAESFAVVGMAAYFSAIVRAPLTGVVLVVEMTGNYSLILPLLAASLSAYGLADYLGDRPVYEALLERDALRESARA